MGESEGSLRQNAASMNKNRIRGIQIEMRRPTLHRLGLAHGAHLAAGAAIAVEEAGAVGLETRSFGRDAASHPTRHFCLPVAKRMHHEDLAIVASGADGRDVAGHRSDIPRPQRWAPGPAPVFMAASAARRR